MESKKFIRQVRKLVTSENPHFPGKDEAFRVMLYAVVAMYCGLRGVKDLDFEKYAEAAMRGMEAQFERDEIQNN